MNEINIESLTPALDKEGHALEEKARRILAEKGFNCERNPPVESGDIDIIAHSYECNAIIIVQSKGNSPNNILSLYGNTTETIKLGPNVISVTN